MVRLSTKFLACHRFRQNIGLAFFLKKKIVSCIPKLSNRTFLWLDFERNILLVLVLVKIKASHFSLGRKLFHVYVIELFPSCLFENCTKRVSIFKMYDLVEKPRGKYGV